MRFVYTILICLLLSLTSGFAAASFSATAEIIDNRVFTDEVAEFIFTIRNFDVNQDQYTIFTTDPSWNVYHESTAIYVSDKGTQTFDVILDPTSVITAGKVYSVPITIKSMIDGEETQLALSITVDSDSQRTYQPAVFLDVAVNENGEVNPTRPVELLIRLINKNNLDMENIYVEIDGELISDDFSLNLGPKEEVVKVLTYNLDPMTLPQKQSVDVTLYYEQKAIGPAKRAEYQIVKYQPSLKRDVKEDTQSKLYSQFIVELTNKGNVLTEEQFLYPMSTWAQKFTSGSEPANYVEQNGERYAVFDISLASGESSIITVETDYRSFTFWMVLIAVIIIGSIVAYYVLRAPIVIKKRVQVVSNDAQGTNKLKIVLDVKNRTGKLLKNVRVLERAPHITEVDEEFGIGTLAPTKIVKHALKGTLIRWDFNSIEPYEERIITYTINSKLSILGDMKLPTTLVKYESFGQTRTVKEEQVTDVDEE